MTSMEQEIRSADELLEVERLTTVLSAEWLEQQGVLPLRMSDGAVVVGTWLSRVDPLVLDDLRLLLGADVVLELGFFTRAQRERFRQLASDARIPVEAHVLDVPREVRRERVRLRNQGSPTYTVEVDAAMFDWAEGYYEPLDESELAAAHVMRA